MTAVIIDDEKGGRVYLNDLLDRYCPDIKVLGTARDLESGLLSLEEHMPEVVFLDIELPGGSGFRLLDHFENPPFQVVFTTAYDSYAIRAFRYAAVDYLLKPIDKVQLQESIVRARVAGLTTHADKRLKVVRETLENQQISQIVFAKSRGSEVFDLVSISHIESAGNYSLVFSGDNDRTMVSENLKQIDERIQSDWFYRIQQSFIINLHAVKEVDFSSASTVTLKNNLRLKIARRKKKDFMEVFERFMKQERSEI